MTRVSTFGNYQSALLNLMSAQGRGADAQRRLATEKVATDVAGFGRTSETVTALKSSLARVNGFVDVNKMVDSRLASQDLSLNRVADAADGARQAIAEAISAGRFDTLMQDLENQFANAREGLNAKHNGLFLYGGANSDTRPVTADTLADLTAAASVDAVFANDTVKSRSRVDETTSLETGFLADEVGTELFAILRDIQAFHEATPIGGAGDEATRDFLTAQLTRLDTAHGGLVEQAANNGGMQKRVEGLLESHSSQAISLEKLLGDRTDADLAKALTDMELSQIAIQASAQVVNTLRDSSLINFLR